MAEVCEVVVPCRELKPVLDWSSFQLTTRKSLQSPDMVFACALKRPWSPSTLRHSDSPSTLCTTSKCWWLQMVSKCTCCQLTFL
eukprot:m.20791 g.20791  ORF g.20791 m.20791 type:complete len:84 (+) comp32280_c0_seq1:189-440(+)